MSADASFLPEVYVPPTVGLEHVACYKRAFLACFKGEEDAKIFSDRVRKGVEEGFPDRASPDWWEGDAHGFHVGLAAGVEQGDADGYQRGHAAGLKQGTADGLQRGREQGDVEGRRRGREEGAADGYKQGHAAGVKQGTADGLQRGREQGDAEGRRRGREEGAADGYEQGHAAGVKQGTASGYQQGHAAGVGQGDADGYQRGLAEGSQRGLADRVAQERQQRAQAEEEKRLQEFEEDRRRELRPSAYDFVLEFGSLSDFLASGRIGVESREASTFNLSVVAKNCRVIAVVGLFDKGKTFLINELFELNLPSGKLCTTTGLSFYWAEKQKMLLVDSAGLQAPVSHRGQTDGVQPIVDAQATESITFEVISQIAQQILVVVSDLTWLEQKYISELCKKGQRRGSQAKDLIVVHNMRTTGEVSEATELFAKQIVQIYDGVAPVDGQLFYSEQKGRDAPVVQHIGICQKGTPAGGLFNDSNLSLVKSMLSLRDTVGTDVKIGELLAKQFKNVLPSFVVTETSNGDDAIAAELLVEFEHGPQAGLVLKAPMGVKPVMRTMGVFSNLNEISTHDVSFEPPFAICDDVRCGQVIRLIVVECPGVTPEDVEVTEMATGIKVEITKLKTVDEVAMVAITQVGQTHGKWEREFLFDDGRFEVSEAGFLLENGLLKIPLRKQLQQRRFRPPGAMPRDFTRARTTTPVISEVAPSDRDHGETDETRTSRAAPPDVGPPVATLAASDAVPADRDRDETRRSFDMSGPGAGGATRCVAPPGAVAALPGTPAALEAQSADRTARAAHPPPSVASSSTGPFHSLRTPGDEADDVCRSIDTVGRRDGDETHRSFDTVDALGFTRVEAP